MYSRVWLISALIGLLAGLAARAQDPAPCPDEMIEKDELCGFVRAAAAQIDREKSLDPETRMALLDLQNETDVTHCFLDIEVTISPNPSNKITGSNTLDVTSRANGLTQFTLNLKSNMTVTGVLVNGASAAFTRPTDKIVITLDKTYNSGQTFQVKVSYNGTPTGKGMGGTAGDTSGDSFTFKTHGSPAVSIVSSLSQPYFAYTWWPCKDDLVSNEDKFTMDLWVTAPSTLTVASNGTLQGIDSLSGSRSRTRWKSNFPNTTYGVSVAMTNYSKTIWGYPYPGGTMPVELYLYPETASTSLSSLSNLVEMITTLAQPGTFGEFPFVAEKYGIAQFPTNFGVEHQTITSQGNFVERRNVHEMAHSWWGNSITCKTWNHIWVNEGWARYAESLYYERRPGGNYAAYLSHLNTYRPSTSNFGGVIYRTDLSSSDTIFDSGIVYDKGQWVLHMLRHVLGEPVFFQCFANYRALYEGGTAGIDDYQSVVESTAGRDMDWFFNEWIYAGGAPYYRYGWEQETVGGQNYVRLYVQQYQDTLATPLPLMTMPIDIRLTTAGGSQTQSVNNLAAAQQWFLIPASASVTALDFDPDTWILRGDAASVNYVQGPPKLLSATPAPGQTINSPLSQVTLRFSQPVSVSVANFHLVDKAGAELPVSFQYNTSTYQVTLAAPKPLHTGYWTVTIDPAVSSSGMSLDGEIGVAGSLPSGDGFPGGASIYTFRLPAPGDLDDDGDVDVSDVQRMVDCLSGADNAILPGCGATDFDHDNDADQADLGRFQRCISGPDVGPAWNCMQ